MWTMGQAERSGESLFTVFLETFKKIMLVLMLDRALFSFHNLISFHYLNESDLHCTSRGGQVSDCDIGAIETVGSLS